MAPPEPDVRAAAERAHAYLAESDPLPAAGANAIVGFGVFDLGLARHCGDLFRHGLAPRLVFTGGIGAGTGRLGQPEADAWRAELRRSHPEIGDADVILENRSTNTAENIDFTAALLAREHPSLAFGRGLQRIVAVASPSRLRRVGLTLRLKFPALRVTRHAPPATLDTETALYAAHGVDFLAHLAGELDRLVSYPARGWIVAEPLSPAIAAVHAVLRAFAAARTLRSDPLFKRSEGDL